MAHPQRGLFPAPLHELLLWLFLFPTAASGESDFILSQHSVSYSAPPTAIGLFNPSFCTGTEELLDLREASLLEQLLWACFLPNQDARTDARNGVECLQAQVRAALAESKCSSCMSEGCHSALIRCDLEF